MTTRLTRAVGLTGLGALIAATLPPAGGQEPKPYPKPALTFVVLKDGQNRFHWRLQDKENVVMAVSAGKYMVKQEARDAIEEVRKLAGTDKVKYVFHQDAKMLHRWRLTVGKDRVLAESGEGYQEKELADKRAATVKEAVKDAEVVDKTTN